MGGIIVTTQAPLRVAVVGVGHWHAPRYIDMLRRLGEKLVAVWDADPAQSRQVAGDTGAATEVDLAGLLAHTHPDLIVGMGVHSQMPALLSIMLDCPAALILEKPLGIHSADVAPLVARAERDGRYASLAFTHRCSELWTRIDALAAAGRLGRPCYAHFRVINGSPARYRRDGCDWMLDPAQSGGGSLINLGTHTLDAFFRFTGEEVSVESAQLGFRAHGEPVEDYSLAILRSASGALASVESGYCYAGMTGGDQEWRLVTENAYLVQRPESLTVQTLDDGKLERLPGTAATDPYDLYITDALRRFRAGLPPAATLRDGLKVLQLIETLYRVAKVSR
jgi:predicted dehydrogenase